MILFRFLLDISVWSLIFAQTSSPDPWDIFELDLTDIHNAEGYEHVKQIIPLDQKDDVKIFQQFIDISNHKDIIMGALNETFLKWKSGFDLYTDHGIDDSDELGYKYNLPQKYGPHDEQGANLKGGKTPVSTFHCSYYDRQENGSFPSCTDGTVKFLGIDFGIFSNVEVINIIKKELDFNKVNLETFFHFGEFEFNLSTHRPKMKANITYDKVQINFKGVNAVVKCSLFLTSEIDNCTLTSLETGLPDSMQLERLEVFFFKNAEVGTYKRRILNWKDSLISLQSKPWAPRFKAENDDIFTKGGLGTLIRDLNRTLVQGFATGAQRTIQSSSKIYDLCQLF